jgi:hypothetical protein
MWRLILRGLTEVSLHAIFLVPLLSDQMTLLIGIGLYSPVSVSKIEIEITLLIPEGKSRLETQVSSLFPLYSPWLVCPTD